MHIFLASEYVYTVAFWYTVAIHSTIGTDNSVLLINYRVIFIAFYRFCLKHTPVLWLCQIRREKKTEQIRAKRFWFYYFRLYNLCVFDHLIFN